MTPTTMHAFVDDAGVQRARRWLDEQQDAITDLQLEFARLPSPDLRAVPRARLFEQCLRDAGIDAVQVDAVGNVLGSLPGTRPLLPAVVLSAHLDSVFPHLETIAVERDGSVLRGPGIADDAAGLAGVVFLVQALQRSGCTLERNVVLAATVGEEGEGDLAGVKHLFHSAWAARPPQAFLTLDIGSPRHAAHAGLGSRRFEVHVQGPGGHSWGDFGRPNPIHALARSVALFLDGRSSRRARGSWNVGRIEGGQGVNAIPEEASLRIDLRSREADALEELVLDFHRAIEDGLRQEQEASQTAAGALQHEVRVIGDRPMGETPRDADLPRIMQAAFEACDLPLVFTRSSTDANVPMSLGVPALAVPHGVRAFNAHSEAEWCDVSGRSAVLGAELLAVLALAGAVCGS
jgi:acetylornithine deacetylase/succinyl-diaminopimelate desuccinylase-like protein